MCWLSRNLAYLIFWNPQGQSRPVQGWLYLYPSVATKSADNGSLDPFIYTGRSWISYTKISWRNFWTGSNNLVKYVSKIASSPQVFIQAARRHSTWVEKWSSFLTTSHGACLDWTWWNDSLATRSTDLTPCVGIRQRQSFCSTSSCKFGRTTGKDNRRGCKRRCGHDL